MIRMQLSPLYVYNICDYMLRFEDDEETKVTTKMNECGFEFERIHIDAASSL